MFTTCIPQKCSQSPLSPGLPGTSGSWQVGLVLLLFCTGCLGPIDGLYPPQMGESQREIYVYDNHWHTGLMLQTSGLSPRLRQYLRPFEASNWVEIGWGDDGFYRAENETVLLALQALFFSRASVLHVADADPDPVTCYRGYKVDLYQLRLSQEGYCQLEQFIVESFALNVRCAPIDLQPGLYRFSRFYAARGHYGMLHTCNHWTAESLRKTGFPITPAYALTAGNVALQLRANRIRRIERAEPPAPPRPQTYTLLPASSLR
jgi:uncharacterized protein (TIGR02117 family)